MQKFYHISVEWRRKCIFTLYLCARFALQFAVLVGVIDLLMRTCVMDRPLRWNYEKRISCQLTWCAFLSFLMFMSKGCCGYLRDRSVYYVESRAKRLKAVPSSLSKRILTSRKYNLLFLREDSSLQHFRTFYATWVKRRIQTEHFFVECFQLCPFTASTWRNTQVFLPLTLWVA